MFIDEYLKPGLKDARDKGEALMWAIVSEIFQAAAHDDVMVEDAFGADDIDRSYANGLLECAKEAIARGRAMPEPEPVETSGTPGRLLPPWRR